MTNSPRDLLVVCPLPGAWDRVFHKLSRATAGNEAPKPPVPLILNGWFFSNDFDKQQRWRETCLWAEEHHLEDIVGGIAADEWYRVESMSGYRPYSSGTWRSEPSPKPTAERVTDIEAELQRDWSAIVGPELAAMTRPTRLTGSKRQRLLVAAREGTQAPWGAWDCLVANRHTFTEFRDAVNRAVHPHWIDHIDFWIDREWGQ